MVDFSINLSIETSKDEIATWEKFQIYIKELDKEKERDVRSLTLRID